VAFTPVEILQVASQPTAIVRGPATATNLPPRIRALFAEFYQCFKGKAGLNIVYYPSWHEVHEFDIECGAQVNSGGNSATPGGTVATLASFGPYDQMKSAHEEIHRYVRANGHQIAGPSWEVYGHGSDDPAQLRTDIFYLLAH
jgi:effector-binding domain-containing protein